MEAGRRLGRYEIVAPLGEGGMGEVWRARDTTLDRDVAIKVLPADLASDPERLARLEREAKVLAQLEHPNVAAVYGLERVEPDGESEARFLVMQLAEGETLADRVAAGPLPIDEAVEIALQIASGLEAAHERGIVHRDLKPANVMVDGDGHTKVLDFGLAKALGPEAEETSPELTASPTVLGATAAGTIMGTAGYMAPEQARGKRIDKRADIWAFGCVLWEMLTGSRLFDGDNVTDVIAAVVTREPDWEPLPDATPPRIVALLRRCLDRDSGTRLRDIGEARVVLSAAEEPLPKASPASDRPPLRLVALGVVLFVAGVLAALAAGRWIGPDDLDPAVGPTARVTVPAPDWAPVGFASGLYLTPDGRTLGYHERGTGALRLRDLDSWSSRTVPGTDGSRDGFLSPDGRWFVYLTPDDRIEKILIDGGTPVELVRDVGIFNSGVWSESGWLYLSADIGDRDGVWRMRSDGGELELLMERNGTTNGWFLDLLPDDRALLFTALPGPGSDLTAPRIDALMLDDLSVKTVLEGGRQARYLPPGHLVVVTGEADLSVGEFDADEVTIAGPLRLAERGMHVDSGFNARYTVGSDGTLVYVPAVRDAQDRHVLWWGPEEGLSRGIELPGRSSDVLSQGLRVSPDGSTLSVALTVANGVAERWLVDADRGASTPLRAGGEPVMQAVWSPDGRHLAVVRPRSGGFVDLGVSIVPVDESAASVELSLFPDRGDGSEPSRNGQVFIGNWSPDGERIVVTRTPPNLSDREIWVMSRDPDKVPERVIATEEIEFSPRFSPDGTTISYTSSRTGREELYLRPYPGPGREVAVTSGGGTAAVWRPDGRALYFLRPGQDAIGLWEIELGDGDPPRPGAERKLADLPSGIEPYLDVDPSTGRVVMAVSPGGISDEIRVVLNWTEELKRLREQ